MNPTTNSHSACSSVSNTNKTCYELSNDTSARWASLGTSNLPKIISQEAILCSSSKGYFVSSDNDIHCVRCHRTVRLNDAEAELADSDSMSCPLCKDIFDVKHNTGNTHKTSFKRQFYGFVPAYFRTMITPLTDDPFKGADCNPTFMDICALVANIYYPPASYFISAIQIATFVYVFVNIPVAEAKAIENVIEIDKFETLRKIGKDNDYRSDGNFILTKYLVADEAGYPVIDYFTGSLDGDGYTISNQSGCLIRHFEGHGIIGNLLFNDSHSTSASNLPLVAKMVSGHAVLKNIRVNGYTSHMKQHDIKVGIIAETLSDFARMEDCSLVNANIKLVGLGQGFGFLVFKMKGNSFAKNNMIINVNVSAYNNIPPDGEPRQCSLGSIVGMSDIGLRPGGKNFFCGYDVFIVGI